MSTSTPPPDNNDEPATPEQFPHEEPAWAASLREMIQDLPGKLKATITDEDKSSLAEAVHSLFEGSGAFDPPTNADSEVDDAESDAESTEETPPKKGGGLQGFARRFAGEE